MDDVIRVIFSFIDEESTCSFILVSKSWRDVALTSTPKIYKKKECLEAVRRGKILQVFLSLQDHWAQDAFLEACRVDRPVIARKLMSYLVDRRIIHELNVEDWWNRGALLSLQNDSTTIAEEVLRLGRRLHLDSMKELARLDEVEIIKSLYPFNGGKRRYTKPHFWPDVLAVAKKYQSEKVLEFLLQQDPLE